MWCSRSSTARWARTEQFRVYWSSPASPTSGAGVLGSAVGMDKDVAKRLLRAAGIPVAAYQVVRKAEFERNREAACRRASEVGFPLFSKPANPRVFSRRREGKPSTSTRNGAALEIPARLDAAQVETVQRMAVAAFHALEGHGMARVDFFVREDGALLVNEVNTIPGFTAISMYPKLWEASGATATELVTRLIDLALARHAARAALSSSAG